MLTVDDGRFHFTPKGCVDVSSGRTCIGPSHKVVILALRWRYGDDSLESPTRYISTLGGTRAWFVQHHRANSSWYCEVGTKSAIVNWVTAKTKSRLWNGLD